MKDKVLPGKKTYSVGIAMIITAIQPMFSDSGIDLGALNWEMFYQGLVAITIRLGLAKQQKS